METTKPIHPECSVGKLLNLYQLGCLFLVCVQMHGGKERIPYRHCGTRTKEEEVSFLQLLIDLCADRWEAECIL